MHASNCISVRAEFRFCYEKSGVLNFSEDNCQLEHGAVAFYSINSFKKRLMEAFLINNPAFQNIEMEKESKRNAILFIFGLQISRASTKTELFPSS